MIIALVLLNAAAPSLNYNLKPITVSNLSEDSEELHNVEKEGELTVRADEIVRGEPLAHSYLEDCNDIIILPIPELTKTAKELLNSRETKLVEYFLRSSTCTSHNPATTAANQD